MIWFFSVRNGSDPDLNGTMLGLIVVRPGFARRIRWCCIDFFHLPKRPVLIGSPAAAWRIANIYAPLRAMLFKSFFGLSLPCAVSRFPLCLRRRAARFVLRGSVSMLPLIAGADGVDHRDIGRGGALGAFESRKRFPDREIYNPIMVKISENSRSGNIACTSPHCG